MTKVFSKSNIITITEIAIGAALLAVCSWISIPTTVPFTMQTFGVFFILLLLGGKKGTLSILIYMLLGAVGVPVFAGFSGGIGTLFGLTGGYIMGFLLTGLFYLACEKLVKNEIFGIASLVCGLALCYLAGTLWFVTVYAKTGGAMTYGAALMTCVVPYLIPDGAKLALAVVVARRVKKAVPMLSDKVK